MMISAAVAKAGAAAGCADAGSNFNPALLTVMTA